jgi:hypothetical protein
MSPLRAIAALAAPTTLLMLVAAASNVLATWYVSRLGADAIAAVSLVFPLSLLATTAMAGGIGAGASAAVARALGAGRSAAADVLAGQSLLLSVAAGLAFGACILVGAPTMFRWMGASGEVLDAATLFARVLFGGAAITFAGAMLDSVLRGEGNTRVPAFLTSVSLVLQMATTPLAMFSAGLGLVGAAVAPLACQLVAIIPRARFVFGGASAVRPSIGLSRARADARHPAHRRSGRARDVAQQRRDHGDDRRAHASRCVQPGGLRTGHPFRLPAPVVRLRRQRRDADAGGDGERSAPAGSRARVRAPRWRAHRLAAGRARSGSSAGAGA